VVQPAPAPRFSATPGAIQAVSPAVGAHNDEAFADWGFAATEIEALKTAGAL
jgi:alpha-methylacyl-CoA racemase